MERLPNRRVTTARRVAVSCLVFLDVGVGHSASVQAGETDVDVALVKGAAPDPVFLGSPLTFVLTTSNVSLATALDVVMTDALPSGMTLSSAVASQGACSGTSVVTCSFGDIDSHLVATVTIEVVPTVATGCSVSAVNAASVTTGLPPV